MTQLADAPAISGATGTAPWLSDANQALLIGARPANRRQLSLSQYDNAGRPSPLPPWAVHAEQELQQLVDLPAGWDGHRGKRMAEAAVEAVVRVLDGCMTERTPFPQYFPLPDGGVQVEWHANGHDIEVEADAAGSVYVLATTTDPRRTRVDAQLASTVADTSVLNELRSALHDLAARVAAAS